MSNREIRTTSHFDQKVRKRIKMRSQLRQKTKKQVGLLKQNMRHPSLKLHKLTGKRAEEYSFWIEGDLRITFKFVDGAMLFTDLITHTEY